MTTATVEPAARRSVPRRGLVTRAALMRARYADQFRPAYRKAVREALAAHARLVAADALVGFPRPELRQAALARKLAAIKRRFVAAIVAAGYDYAGAEVEAARPGKAWNPWLRGKGDVPAVTVGANRRDLLLVGKFTDVERWIETTSAHESASATRKFAQVWADAEASRDPETGKAWTPAQISRAILDRGIADSEWRSDMLARTGTIWAVNEGAEQRYRAAGVAVKEWVATTDDATCPFCQTLDGKDVRLGDEFWHGGTDMGVRGPGGVSVLSVPSGVSHPPLHPNCRCTLVPVIR